MKNEKDIRINAYLFLKEYAFYFFLLAAFNGFHMWIYQTLMKKGFLEANLQFAINVLILYVMVSAALSTLTMAIFREKFFTRPIKKLSEAARNIARGNFTVHIEARHNYKRKDMLDVMIDDFNTMAEELASTETLKNDFIANISHEIKTPLSVIQFYTTALQNEAMKPEERREYIQIIHDSTQKLSVLVTNILRLSKLENQGIISEAKPFDLSEQLRLCALSFADQLQQKNIRFEEDLDEVSICYDENMLETVWNNLLSNAIKFTSPGGSIFITLKAENNSIKNFVRVSVTDTGCGMDEATQKRIFDKFFQGNTPHAKEGNGLGLALVKKTIELLDGTVTVDSSPGNGSTFTVCLKI